MTLAGRRFVDALSDAAAPSPMGRTSFRDIVISEMRPVKPEKIARGKIARGLCLNDSYACAFGYCQNGRRLEPTRESTLGTHV
jgi:hypothetical protein